MDFRKVCEFMNGVTEEMEKNTTIEVITELDYKVEKTNKDVNNGYAVLDPVILDRIHKNHMRMLGGNR